MTTSPYLRRQPVKKWASDDDRICARLGDLHLQPEGDRFARTGTGGGATEGVLGTGGIGGENDRFDGFGHRAAGVDRWVDRLLAGE